MNNLKKVRFSIFSMLLTDIQTNVMKIIQSQVMVKISLMTGFNI
jgi:hypothetical protein